MKKLIFTFLTLLTMALSTAAASAATMLLTETHNYGTGQYDPGGTDVLGPGYVQVSDQSSGRFSDTWNFAGLLPLGSLVTGIDLILTFDRSGPFCPFGLCGIGEIWSARITGSTAGAGDDYFAPLSDILSPQTISISAGTDGGSIDAFLHTVATGSFELLFSELSFGPDSFRLASATVQVMGELAPVPLPAAGLLLFGAIGGLALFRRRAGHTLA